MSASGISVVIPLYNKRSTVKRAIDSILAQRDASFELIVVDDGSSDGSADWVEVTYGDQLRLYRQDNSGPSAARNRGVALATYPLVVFLDADDEFLPGCLVRHLRCFAAYPDVDVSISGFRVFDHGKPDQEERIAERLGPCQSDFVFTEIVAATVLRVPSGSFALSKVLFEKIGGFDPYMHRWEIADFMLRACLGARKIGLHNAVSVVIYQDSGNSQFSRTQGSAEMDTQFAQKILLHASAIPLRQRNALLGQAVHIAYSLWADGDMAEFQQIGRQLLGLHKNEIQTGRLLALSRLPLWLLQLIARVRSGRALMTGRKG